MNYLADYGDEENEGERGRTLPSYTAPKALLEHIPLEENEDADETEAHRGGLEGEEYFGKSRRIVDRESEYHRRRLERTLSPPRVDPFALPQSSSGGPQLQRGQSKKAKTTAPNSTIELRTYQDAVKDANLERERFYTLRNIEQKQKREKEEREANKTETHDNFSERKGLSSAATATRSRSRSPTGERERRGGRDTERDRRRGKGQREYRWGKEEDDHKGKGGGNDKNGDGDGPAPEPTANFGLSGMLAEETLTVKGVKLMYTEPPEKAVPTKRWRLYVFKNGKPLESEGSGGVLHIHRQSMYLLGRERKIVDIPTDHPSCSKQHAVVQYRQIEKEDPVTGFPKRIVNPYLIDLGSTNGSFINGERLEPQRYYQLLEGDTVKFGSSSREYVMLHDKSS